jgi:hypothetical protein
MNFTILAVVGALIALAPNAARADGLATLIPHLFDSTIVLDNPGHQAHFQRAEGFLAPELINQSIISQLSTFPLSSSSGGFTYAFDSNLGTFNRTSESFGPIFAERTQTLGRGKWNAGFSYSQAEYDSIDDLDLGSGELQFVLTHLDVPGNNFFEGDLILAQTRLSVDTQTSLFFVSYGISDRVDVSVAVPVIKVDLDASAQLTIDRLSTSTIPAIHRFPGGASQMTIGAEGDASGVGDVVVRGKFRFADNWAGLLAVRLPTGDEEDLLGTGATQFGGHVVGSWTVGKFGPHLNLGYVVSSGSSDVAGDLPDEIKYAAGFDLAVHPRVTFALDAVGRVLRDATRLVEHDRSFTFFTLANPTPQTATRRDLVGETDDLNLLLGSAGIKYNPTGNLLLTANLLYPLSNDGLKTNGIVGLFQLDYSF